MNTDSPFVCIANFLLCCFGRHSQYLVYIQPSLVTALSIQYLDVGIPYNNRVVLSTVSSSVRTIKHVCVHLLGMFKGLYDNRRVVLQSQMVKGQISVAFFVSTLPERS